jgi:hypothetical protein
MVRGDNLPSIFVLPVVFLRAQKSALVGLLAIAATLVRRLAGVHISRCVCGPSRACSLVVTLHIQANLALQIQANLATQVALVVVISFRQTILIPQQHQFLQFSVLQDA